MSTTDSVAIPGGSANVATYAITEDSKTKELQRLAVNSGDGVEVVGYVGDTAYAGSGTATIIAALKGIFGNGTTNGTGIGGLTDTAPASDTASASLNGRLQRVAQRISSLIGLFPSAIGPQAKAGSLAITVATDDPTLALYGPVTETAPASDTASSGQNGRLQRIAQNITTFSSGLLAAVVTAGAKKVMQTVLYNSSGTEIDFSSASSVVLNAGNAVVGQVKPAGRSYETVAASQTAQAMGATGATGDVLDGVLIVPASTSPGAVSIKDGAGSAITIFTGGASSVGSLVPFFIPVGATSLAGAWQITTGASVSAIGVGSFT